MPHGQTAGYLGKICDPFVLNADPFRSGLQGTGHASAGLHRRGARRPSPELAQCDRSVGILLRVESGCEVDGCLHLDVVSEGARGLGVCSRLSLTKSPGTFTARPTSALPALIATCWARCSTTLTARSSRTYSRVELVWYDASVRKQKHIPRSTPSKINQPCHSEEVG
jgi:hypothetical protein